MPSQLIRARRDERVRGVIVTLKGDGVKNGCLSPSGAPYDFMSRYFGPWVGITEDPVTGNRKSKTMQVYVQRLKNIFSNYKK